MKDHQITVKMYRSTHKKLRAAQAKLTGRRGKVVPMVQVADEIVDAGIERKRLK